MVRESVSFLGSAVHRLGKWLASPAGKITFASVITPLIALLVLTTYLHTALRESAITTWANNSVRTIATLAAHLDQVNYEAQQRLLFLANQPPFRSPPNVSLIDRRINGIPENADPERRSALDWILNEREHHFSVLFVLLPNGDHYLAHPYSVQKNLQAYNLAHRPYVQMAQKTGKPVVSDAFIGADGVPAIAVLIPTTDDSGNIHSYLGGAIHVGGMKERLANAINDSHVTLFLRDRDQRLIAWQGEPLSPQWRVLAAPSLPSTGDTVIFSKSQDVGEYQVNAIQSPADATSPAHLLVSTRLKSGWEVGTTRTVASINAEIRPSLHATIGLAALLLALVSSAGAYAIWRVGARWRRAQRALSESRDNLELRVQERTQALEQQRQILSAITDNASDAIISVDSRQRITFWNPAASALLGYGADEMLGQPLSPLLPDDFKQRHHDAFVAANQNARLTSGDCARMVKARAKNGDLIDIELTLSIWEANGERFFTAFMRDIRDRLAQESSIRTLSLAVEQSPVSVVIANCRGEIEFVNTAFERISGYTQGDVYGQTPSLFKSGQTPPQVYSELWGNITHGKPWEGELINRRKNGELFWEYARISPVINDRGVTTHYLAIKEDISQLKRTEEHLRTELRLRQILSACNHSLVRAVSEEAFLQELCEELVTQGGYAFAWIGYAADANAGQLVVKARSGDDHGYLDQFDDQTRGRYIAGDAIRSDQTLFGNPGRDNNPADWEKVGLQCGFNTSIALPVVAPKHDLYGVLRIYRKDIVEFEPAEKVLLEELSRELRYGIINHRIRHALDESAAQFRSLSEDSIVGVYMIADKRFVYVNPKMAELFGYPTAEAMVGLGVESLVHPSDREMVSNKLQQRLAGEIDSVHYTFKGLRQDNTDIDVEVFGARTHYRNGPAVVGCLLDITERNRQSEHLSLLQEALEASNEGIAISDHRQRDNPFVYINPAFKELTGYDEQDAIGQNGRFLLGENRLQPALPALVEALREGRATRVELQNYRKDGSMFWNQLSVAPVRDSDGALTHFVSILRDDTERRFYINQLERLTHFDPLTEVANRNLLQDRLSQALMRSQRQKSLIGLMLVDIRRFKTLTQTLGTQASEAILIKVAKRLLSRIRKGDTVARIGNDQFAVLLDNVTRESDLTTLATELLETVNRSMDIGAKGLRIDINIGITMAPADGNSAEQLIKNAYAALMDTGTDNNTFRFFKPKMNKLAAERMELELDLRTALNEQQFVLHYQPKVRLSDGVIVGAEALVRWQHPQRGLMFPDLFIPLAEETGLIRPLGDWVLNEACRYMADLNQHLETPLSIAVNFSVEQFASRTLIDKVQCALQAAELPHHLLECELTESLLMKDPQGAVSSLNALKALSARISLDDFGTGYSSLSYLKRFPIDVLKIDRSFVMDLPEDEQDVAIVRAVVALALSLDLDIVAEGVETLEQALFLRDLGCQTVQGYHFSKPIPADDFVRLVKHQTPYTLD